MTTRSRSAPPLSVMLCGLALSCAAPALAAAEADAPVDPPAAADDSTAWPLGAAYDGGELHVYQPQPETLSGDRLLTRAAFSVAPAGGGAQPEFGVLWIAAHVDIDREQRTLTLADEAVTRVQLAGADTATVARITSAADQVLKGSDHELSLDRILATLEEAESERQQGDERLGTAPPAIRVVERPTLLLALDGAPEGEPLPNSPFERIVNTPQLVARDPASGSFWLSDDGRWYRAPAITGPWAPATAELDAPTAAALAPLTAVTSAGASAEPAVTPAAGGEPEDILATTEPTELVTVAGQPQYEPIADTGLLGVTNTESDLFQDPAQNLHYVLVSGRWFRTAALRGGTWEHVPGRALPPGFARIPGDSRYGRVLAHVPGTPAAAEAVADARVPQTAAVRRDATVTITYDGEPQFEPIAGTSLAYAVNTPSQVLRTADGQCYDCTQGVWYRSATANGPWAVSTTVPAEVATIPPGSPAYNLRYAYVYDSTDDAVYVGYAPGYLGTFITDGVVVWGTGFTYHGWWHHHYYPHPWTYGFGMAYNPWTGHWGSGFHGGPRGGWPAEGTVGFHGGWLGPAGYHAAFTPRGVRAAEAAEHRPVGAARPGPALHPPLYDNLYRNPANHARIVAGPVTTRPARAQPTGAGAARPPAGPRERVMTDRDGGVYRRNGSAWEQWQHTGWAPLHGEQPRPPAEPPRPPTPGEPHFQPPGQPRPAGPAEGREAPPVERPRPQNPGEVRPPGTDHPRPATPEELRQAAPATPPAAHEPAPPRAPEPPPRRAENAEPAPVRHADAPVAVPPRTPPPLDRGELLERQQRAEERGAQREQQFQQYRSNTWSPPPASHPAPPAHVAPAPAPAPHPAPAPAPVQRR